MTVIVTCGPSYEPVDEVRRLTNFSTGQLGTVLSEAFVRAGFKTICLRGAAATHSALPAGASVRPFTTNDDLAEQLCMLGRKGEIAGIFHAAALCDYRIRRVVDENDNTTGGAKIPSRNGALTIDLEPATKLISHLRNWFPNSLIVGWKYELEGTSADAIGKARHQILENRADGCVVNGRAFGEGFGFVRSTGYVAPFDGKESLGPFLATWLKTPPSGRERLCESIRTEKPRGKRQTSLRK